MTRAIRVLIASAMVVASASVAAPVAAASDRPVIRSIDTTSHPDVELTVMRPFGSSDVARPTVTENDSPVSGLQVQSMAQADQEAGVVLVVDNSAALNDSAAIADVKAAATAMVRAKAPNESYAVVATNSRARAAITFTKDTGLLVDTIDRLDATGENAQWSGLSIAAGLADRAPTLQANVVVISGSQDTLSPSGALASATSQLQAAKATVSAVVLRQRAAVDVAGLQSLVSSTGGNFVDLADAGDATGALTEIGANISSQAVVSYRSDNDGALSVAVAFGGSEALARTSPGTIAKGNAVNPAKAPGSPLPDVLEGPLGLIVVGAISLAGVGVLAYGLIRIVSRDDRELSRMLRPYSDDAEQDERIDFSKLADAAIIKKAVAETAKIAEDRGVLESVRKRLEQADLPLKPAEALFFTAIVAIVAMVIGGVLFGILGLALAGFVFAYLPLAITTFLGRRRRKRFTSQLPDTLQLLSGSLRAGYSLLQGLEAVAQQTEAPMGDELQRALSEARLGRPVEMALQDVSDRMGSDDFEWAVMAIKIQREVGGNLAELLMTVANTMIERERLRREVNALTAEGRISAIVLSLLPPIMGTLIAVLNPAYMEPLLDATLGQIALVVAGVMIVVGYFAMNKMTQIEA